MTVTKKASKTSRTGIKMTKKNRLAILTRAREIISDPKRWTRGALRRKIKGQYRYCLLGACEQAAYELGFAEPGKGAFGEYSDDGHEIGFAYALGGDVSIEEYARRTRHMSPHSVNDRKGHPGAVQLVDDYIKELKKPTPKQ